LAALAWTLAVAALAVAGALGVALHRLRARLRLAQDQLAALDPTGNVRAALGPARERLVVEIRNTREVAAQRSWIGGALGALAPDLIRTEVYRQARPMLEQELRERGLEAAVTIERLR
jgi:hypothetical protein